MWDQLTGEEGTKENHKHQDCAKPHVISSFGKTFWTSGAYDGTYHRDSSTKYLL